MKLLLENMQKSALMEIKEAKDSSSLESLRIKYLGKKGKITDILKQLNNLPLEERPELGKIVNLVRNSVQEELLKKENELKFKELEIKLNSEKIDITIPGRRNNTAKIHPLTMVTREMEDIFLGMGFEIVDGPEVESIWYVFDALNTPKDHPSRDLQDTFYIDNDTVLRTHTSSVQIRTMEKRKPPIKIIATGRVYRRDDVDATHSPMFHQLEGLVVEKDLSMSDLKWVLDTFIKKFFGEETKTRFRPHFFPFTEPSAEVDITCFICKGKGCRVCKNEGYIELLGAGMVHPNVLKNCNIDPNEYSGFAFGMGIDRITMIKFGIDDLRLLVDNDIRFLSQF